MRFVRPIILLVAAGGLAGCGAQILEETTSPAVPRFCGEPAKLFMNFIMHANNISWGPRRTNAAASAVTIELVFENTAKWPLALSNSTNGIVYSVEYSLLGDNGAVYLPKETSGVARDVPAEKSGPKEKSGTKKREKLPDVHDQIKTGEPGTGKLVFEVPRGNYTLSIERKFEGKAVAGSPEDHRSTCKIFSSDFSSPKPAKGRGVSGVY